MNAEQTKDILRREIQAFRILETLRDLKEEFEEDDTINVSIEETDALNEAIRDATNLCDSLQYLREKFGATKPFENYEKVLAKK